MSKAPATNFDSLPPLSSSYVSLSHSLFSLNSGNLNNFPDVKSSAALNQEGFCSYSPLHFTSLFRNCKACAVKVIRINILSTVLCKLERYEAFARKEQRDSKSILYDPCHRIILKFTFRVTKSDTSHLIPYLVYFDTVFFSNCICYYSCTQSIEYLQHFVVDCTPFEISPKPQSHTHTHPKSTDEPNLHAPQVLSSLYFLADRAFSHGSFG